MAHVGLEVVDGFAVEEEADEEYVGRASRAARVAAGREEDGWGRYRADSDELREVVAKADGGLREELEYNFESNSFRVSSSSDVRKQLGSRRAEEAPGPASVGLDECDDRISALSRHVSQYPSPFSIDLSDDREEECCTTLCAPCSTWQPAEQDDGDAEESLVDGHAFDAARVKRGLLQRLGRVWVYMILESSWLCLGLLGILSSILAWCIDEAVAALVMGKASLAYSAQSSVGVYLLWTLFTMALAVGSVLATERISPAAGGSGIPQMKSILAGFQIRGYLSLRTLVSKVIGLLLALSSGMVIGKEGPFVHISSILANQLLRLPIFAEIRRSPALKKQILAAACAVGVSSTFGAPIGGVLFSIEVTSSLYQTSEYWKSFFCVVCGAFVFKELSNYGQSRTNVVSLFTTNFEPLPYRFIELPLFVFLSMICGYLGGCFVILHQRIAALRQTGPQYVRNSYSFALIVAVITSAALFPLGDFMQFSLHNAVDDLFVNDEISKATHSAHWDEPTKFINLLLFAAIKFCLAALAINLPIPCGVFTPMFAVGAAIGRFFGEVIHSFGAQDLTPGGYALVGAASFTAGATGTVSTAVVCFELTSQLSYMLPVLLSVLVGQAAARNISVSIYESLANAKNLPTFPHVRKQSSYSLPVSKVMQPTAPCIPRRVDAEQIEQALLRADNSALDPLYLFAIVDDLDEMYYLGSITWKALHLLKRNRNTWASLGAEKMDLFRFSRIDRSTLALPTTTPLNDAINFFDVHKRKSFFVVEHGKVVGKLYLRDIAALCDAGQL